MKTKTKILGPKTIVRKLKRGILERGRKSEPELSRLKEGIAMPLYPFPPPSWPKAGEAEAKKPKGAKPKVEIEGVEITKPKGTIKPLSVEGEREKISYSYPLIPARPKPNEPVYAYSQIRFNEKSKQHVYSVVEPKITEMDLEIIEKIKKVLEERLDVDISKIGLVRAKNILLKEIHAAIDRLNLTLTPAKRNVLVYYIQRDFLGLGKLEPVLRDPNIEDISCDGVGVELFVYHRNPKLGSLRSNVKFDTADELDSFILKLAQKCNKTISVAEPLLDGTLPDGSRVQATLGTDIARRGSNFTIRKFTASPLTPTHMLKFKSLNSLQLAYLWLAVENGMSILVSGGTATGKTSLLNVLSLFIRPSLKVVSIEDSVAGDSGLLYLNDGYLHSKSIGECIDDLMERYDCEELASGHQVCNNIKNIKVPTLDNKGKIRFVAPSSLIRHKVKKDMYSVTTSSGKSIKVTGDHSIFILGPDSKRMSACKFIESVLENKNPKNPFAEVLQKSARINLLEHINKLDRFFLQGDGVKTLIDKISLKKLREITKSLGYGTKSIKKWYENGILPIKVIRNLNLDLPDNISVRGFSGHPMPVSFEIDKDFMLFLGYIVACGYAQGERNICSRPNEEVKAVVSKLSKKFGFRYSKYSIHSRIFYYILKEVLSIGIEKNKIEERMPSWLLFMPDYLKESFVGGFELGNSKPLYEIRPKLCKTEVRRLRPGDFVVSLKKIPYSGERCSLNILKHLNNFRNKEKLFIEGKGLGNILKTHRSDIKKYVNSNTLKHWIRNDIIRVDVALKIFQDLKIFSSCSIRGKSSKPKFPMKINLDDRFMEFIGLWIADGCFDHNTKSVIISSPKKETEDVVKSLCYEYNLSFSRHSDGFSINVFSDVFYYLMRDVLKLKHGSEVKEVPDWVFKLSNEQVAAFLRGYFAGDNADGRYELGAASKSLKLLKGIADLLLRFGIVSRLRQSNGMHILNVSEIRNVRKFDKIGFIRKDRKERFDNIIGREESGHDCSDVINLPKNFLWQVLDEAKPLIGKRWSYNGWRSLKRRYSKSMPGRKFLKALLKEEVLEKRTQELLEKIVNGEFIFDKIVKIGKLGIRNEFVYDFSIPGYERFFASGILCSNTSELRLPLSHWIPHIARSPLSVKSKVGEVTLFDLLKASLRQRPDYIILGEVRGKEAFVLFQQMATGHASLATIHAASMPQLIDRLTTPPISLPAKLIENIDIVVFLVLGRLKGVEVRRVNNILEITGVEKDSPVSRTIFEWLPSKDKFVPKEKSILLQKIAKKNGVDDQYIIEELYRRVKILEWMAERGIYNYREVARVIQAYYQNPEKVLDYIEGAV
jgi:type IV secretory pathway ATPase VirB11/archaellum biosynthesis ATPase